MRAGDGSGLGQSCASTPSAAVDAVWWGASNGGTSLIPYPGSVPHNERIEATSSCSVSFKGLMMPGMREASMVLPVPGGPVIIR